MVLDCTLFAIYNTPHFSNVQIANHAEILFDYCTTVDAISARTRSRNEEGGAFLAVIVPSASAPAFVSAANCEISHRGTQGYVVSQAVSTHRIKANLGYKR